MLIRGNLETGVAVTVPERDRLKQKALNIWNHKHWMYNSSIYLETVADAYPIQR